MVCQEAIVEGRALVATGWASEAGEAAHENDVTL